MHCETFAGQIMLIAWHDAQKPREQLQKLELIRNDPVKRSFGFELAYDDTPREQKIRFDNGWIVNKFRRLGYIQWCKRKFCGLGVRDYDFRQYSAIIVDSFRLSLVQMGN